MDEVDRTMPREKYEELVRQMRENLRGAIDGRKKYSMGEEAIKVKEVASDESGKATSESSGDSTVG